MFFNSELYRDLIFEQILKRNFRAIRGPPLKTNSDKKGRFYSKHDTEKHYLDLKPPKVNKRKKDYQIVM